MMIIAVKIIDIGIGVGRHSGVKKELMGKGLADLAFGNFISSFALLFKI